MTPNEKAVQDNIVESWQCVDCGVNTHPGTLSGPELRIALALGDEVPIRFTTGRGLHGPGDCLETSRHEAVERLPVRGLP
jgi:hypothetical protein